MRGRHTLTVVVGVLCLLLAGCGGSPEPKPAPKSEPSTSPSASATPPVMPDAAKEKTKDGAVAFARSFIETLNFAGTSGNTKPMRFLYIANCTRCEAIADGIDKTYADGGYFEGGEWRPTRFKFYALKNNVAVLDATVAYEKQTWVKKEGSEPVTYRGSENNLKAFNLRWEPTGWKVSALDPTA